MIVVTLIYADGRTWIAGGFDSLGSAAAWVENEQKQPYWVNSTQIQITDNSPVPEASSVQG